MHGYSRKCLELHSCTLGCSRRLLEPLRSPTKRFKESARTSKGARMKFQALAWVAMHTGTTVQNYWKRLKSWAFAQPAIHIWHDHPYQSAETQSLHHKPCIFPPRKYAQVSVQFCTPVYPYFFANLIQFKCDVFRKKIYEFYTLLERILIVFS